MGKIVSRADGVFLWLKLVLQEIIRGLTNRDTFQDLEERMEVVPQDLEELFSSMLDSIDSFYSKKAAMIFLIVRAAIMSKKNEKTLDTLSLTFALDYETHRIATVKFNLQELRNRNVEIGDHLKARCAGLLEIGRRYSPGFEYLGYRVLHLHRSVREYLERQDVHRRLSNQILEPDFEPYTPLVCSYVKEPKISEARRNILNQLSGLSLFMATVLHYAHEADIARSNA
ncbi:hypothetical protein BOTCAL_0300g00070 [Botryotinia calthae]|uniref:DUF7791 domain-containing protein n=1 Tax=Botryotinia calthae TaxID=38488 RepID=A0A4Y8CWS2_9HELO|nr:hypothetical protein BOTCAL_0300g00070 [Botryotinia calthae]